MSALLAHSLLLLGGFGALYFGAEWLVRGSARIAATLGISPIVVGLTIVSLGTSAPELVVSILATMRGQGDLMLGNVMGSNLANIGLILGTTAVIRPLSVADRVIVRDVPIMIVITVLVFPLLLGGTLELFDGIFLLLLLTVYIAFTFRSADEDKDSILDGVGDLANNEDDAAPGVIHLRHVGLVVAGAIGLGAGGEAIVRGAEFLAAAFGASEMLIGLTVVAIGTSLPELVTSVVAAARKQADIAVGNIIGSNIFNLTAVLGAAALIGEINFSESIVRHDMIWVLALSVLVWPIVASARKVRRLEGSVLLAAYFAIVMWISIER